MIEISRKIKLDLFNELKKDSNSFGEQDSDGILNFLSEIWDLRAMPSTDTRFKDAYSDIYQHTVNNDDWTLDFLFLDRLKLLDNDIRFNVFIENIINPKYRKNEDEIIKYVLLINPYIEKDGYKLGIQAYSQNGLPVYTIQEKQGVDNVPLDIKKNDIVFFVVKNPSGRAHNQSSHTTPNVFPSFVLVFNDSWNDYFTMQTEFSLFYYNEMKDGKYVGETKIMTDSDIGNTSLEMEENFLSLDDTFCSLGQSVSYYENLKEQFTKDFQSILYALRDAAFFPEIQDKFEKKSKFKNSLVRYNENERILREIKYRIYDYDLSNLYKFKYDFQPAFSEQSVEVNFDFDNTSEIPNRIFALIGKNGTGKTQLITSLPLKISKKQNDSFTPRTPLFSKVIAVSYSFFDTFDIPTRTASFNYVYCGLRSEKDGQLSSKGLILRFHSSCKKITLLERIPQLRRIFLNFIEKEIVDEFIIKKSKTEYEISAEGFNNIKDKLSSGQNIILFIITEIVANIRYDSLLLYDEPETHLHPNAITQLMNTIYDLVDEFQSYCIIATHSPLIIRELQSKSVYVIERHENIPSVRKIGMESFGENLTTLTEEVFGNREVPKQYKKIIKNLVDRGRTYEDIVDLLESEDLPLSLNARMFIKSIIKESNEKS
jgi:ABC-type multidrug transport system ATPase subunit